MANERVTPRQYLASYLLLLVLTASTFALSFVSLGALDWAMVLGIAFMKALIIALYFMHLVESSVSHRLAGLVAVAVLAILILLALADAWTRPSPPATLNLSYSTHRSL